MLFGLGAAVLAHEAKHNQGGAIIEGIIRLGPHGATVLLWALAGFSIGFVLIGLMLAVHRMTNSRVLELTEDSILLPHGFLQAQVTRVQYSDIIQVSETKVSSQTFLNLITANRKFCITASLLPDKESYDEIREFFRSRVGVERDRV